jgi:hypothetical protein
VVLGSLSGRPGGAHGSVTIFKETKNRPVDCWHNIKWEVLMGSDLVKHPGMKNPTLDSGLRTKKSGFNSVCLAYPWLTSRSILHSWATCGLSNIMQELWMRHKPGKQPLWWDKSWNLDSMFECRINLKVLEIWFYPNTGGPAVLTTLTMQPHKETTRPLKIIKGMGKTRKKCQLEVGWLLCCLKVTIYTWRTLFEKIPGYEGYKRNARSSDLPARDQQQIATFIRGKLVVGQTALKETRKGEEPRKRRIAFPVSCKILSF